MSQILTCSENNQITIVSGTGTLITDYQCLDSGFNPVPYTVQDTSQLTSGYYLPSLSVSDAQEITGSILLLWAIAFGVRAVIGVVKPRKFT